MNDTPGSKSALYRMGFIMFLAYLAVALPLAVLSIHATRNLGLANWLGGMAVGISFVSTILTRQYAGRVSDLRGGRFSATLGFSLYGAAAALGLFSILPIFAPMLSFSILLIGRLVLGVGESFTIIGVLGWTISIVGRERSGRVMAVVGLAMYAAYGAGGPLGLFVYGKTGMAGLMAASLIMTLVSLALSRTFPAGSAPDPARGDVEKPPFARIMGIIWRYGTIVALQGVGFAVLGAFFSLYMLSRDWPHAGMGLTCFGAGFVTVRLFCGHLPDRMGGLKITAAALLTETAGLSLIWLAPDVWTALCGALLTGTGCSMVFPSMGVEIIRKSPEQMRGTALGLFSAFQDVSYAFAGPLAGVIADSAGYPPVFLMAAVCATIALFLTISTAQRDRHGDVKQTG